MDVKSAAKSATRIPSGVNATLDTNSGVSVVANQQPGKTEVPVSTKK